MSEIHDYLRELIDAGVRSDPLVFAGRRAQSDKVLRTARRLPPDGPKGCTILIMGAPGSGKTALVSHLARALASRPETGALLYEHVPPDAEVAAVYGDIASNLIGTLPSANQRGDTQRSYRGGFNLGLVKAEGRTSERLISPTFHSASAIARARTGDWGPIKRLVVFVDEVQTVAPGSAIARMLRDFHTQSKIPVLLVCAGLANSEMILGDADLTRLENNVHLGRLSEGEALECARKSIETVRSRGVAGSDDVAERWANALARASDHWPRHLQMYLHATWGALCNQDDPNLDNADLATVLGVGDSAREEYYESRIASAHTPLGVIVALHRRMRDGGELDRYEAEDIIGRVIDRIGGRIRDQWATRFDDSTEKCFAQLLKAGVVSLNRMNRCQSPVPSLSNHVLDLKDRA